MGLSLPHLLVLIAVIVLLFGTKKLRTLGSDLGASIKGFKKSMADDTDQNVSDKQESSQIQSEKKSDNKES